MKEHEFCSFIQALIDDACFNTIALPVIMFDGVHFVHSSDSAQWHPSINLNSLQVLSHNMDLQSYLSDLTLFLAPESKTFYILVDNRPWLEDLVSGPAQIWQLMVTKSRMSPFAITKGRKDDENKDDPEFNDLNYCSSPSSRAHKLKKWLSMSTLSRKRVLLPVKKLRTSLVENSKLRRTLYGFIVFEVVWKDVRGVNYLNELQTDTSLAIEAKYMRRWEFDSIAQAAKGITLWLPGTPFERLLLEQHLNSMIGDAFHDAGSETPSTCSSSSVDDNIFEVGVLSEEDENHPCSSPTSIIHGDQSPSLENQDKKSTPNLPNTTTSNNNNNSNTNNNNLDHSTSYTKNLEIETASCESQIPSPCPSVSCQSQIPSPCPSEYVESTDPDEYRDVLLLFRFNDLHLPFKLQKVIMSDLRLLTLLEAGLPSWVIFFQSYPVFCHLYRPWMCPLARGLYVAISFVTVVIGFYDLYKNVPLLKATASRLFGPLFDWIETWEMVSRIKYLGTMLFLHNAEKAVMWFLMVTRTARSLVSVLTQPLVAPVVVVLEVVSPLWNVVIEFGDGLLSFVGILLETSWSLVENLIDVLLLPIWYISSAISNFATTVMSPIFMCLWGAIYAPIHLILKLSNFLGFIYKYMYNFIGSVWLFVSSFLKVASTAEATVKTYDISMLRALWNDLFSKVFRAIKSILYGVVAFFAACNRHRLSIYNHLREFIRSLHQHVQRIRTPPPESRERRGLPNKSTKQS